MAAMLSRLLTCCCRRRRPNFGEPPDEESRLIPAASETITPSLSQAVVIDQERRNERLSCIVRSKEEKMVNINARLPFNLHNKQLSLTFDASPSSRSASNSTHQPNGTTSLSPIYSRSPYHQHTPYVKTPLMNPAASRSSSLVSHGNDSNSSDFEVYARAPILNLRLVTRPSPAISARDNRFNNRGRSRQKMRNTADSVADLAPEENIIPTDHHSRHSHPFTDQEMPSGDQGQNIENGIISFATVNDAPSTPRATVEDSTPRAPMHHPQYLDNISRQPGTPSDQQPFLSISPASVTGFTIHDYDGITIGWND